MASYGMPGMQKEAAEEVERALKDKHGFGVVSFVDNETLTVQAADKQLSLESFLKAVLPARATTHQSLL